MHARPDGRLDAAATGARSGVVRGANPATETLDVRPAGPRSQVATEVLADLIVARIDPKGFVT